MRSMHTTRHSKLIDALPDDNDRGPPLLNPQSCRPRDWTNRRQRAGLTQAEVAIRAGSPSPACEPSS